MLSPLIRERRLALLVNIFQLTAELPRYGKKIEKRDEWKIYIFSVVDLCSSSQKKILFYQGNIA
jgi:hypothetical protein